MGVVINALHALVYAEDPEVARVFFRDVVGGRGSTSAAAG